MNLGPLNRRGVLYQNVPTSGDGGAPVDNFTPLRNLYLTVQSNDKDTADVISQRVAQKADIVWLSRWFPGLTSDMRVTFEGDTFRVTDRKEIGRREGWMIWGQEVR